MNDALQAVLTRWGPVALLEALQEEIGADAKTARECKQPDEARTLEAIAATLGVATMWYAKLEQQEVSR